MAGHHPPWDNILSGGQFSSRKDEKRELLGYVFKHRTRKHPESSLMAYYPRVVDSLQATLLQLMPLSTAQARRVSQFCEALLLAGEVHLTKIARFLHRRTHQDSRVRWISRLFKAPFVSQDHIYHPFLRAMLQGIQQQTWHLVIDRTTLWDGKIDLATISLNYHKRALPLVWCFVPFGGAPQQTYITLLRRCFALVPPTCQVVFHGDTEFGAAEMMHVLIEHGWDFILAQKSPTHFRRQGQKTSQPMASLPVSPAQSVEIANIDVFTKQRVGGLNLLAFSQLHNNGNQRKREVCYLVTSLPLTAGLRRIGRRRWGIEPFHRDYKSSGWGITLSQLKDTGRQEGLLVMVAIVYVWMVCVGRWLCKTGRRHEVDSKAKRHRHLSLFRLGWDWLIHQLRCQLPVLAFLRLYT